MKLLTPELVAAGHQAHRDRNKHQHSAERTPVIAKFFTPWARWTWYMTELDPETHVAFGLVAGHEVELGSFSIRELEEVRGPNGLTIERDLYFGKHTLAEMMDREQELRR